MRRQAVITELIYSMFFVGALFFKVNGFIDGFVFLGFIIYLGFTFIILSLYELDELEDEKIQNE